MMFFTQAACLACWRRWASASGPTAAASGRFMWPGDNLGVESLLGSSPRFVRFLVFFIRGLEIKTILER